MYILPLCFYVYNHDTLSSMSQSPRAISRALNIEKFDTTMTTRVFATTVEEAVIGIVRIS